MYSSLDKIDMTAELGGRIAAVQTDHRSASEIAAEPELSVLFAMTRVLNGRTHLAGEGIANAEVRYMAKGGVPPFLRDALAATGAVLEDGASLGPASADAAGAIADRAFAELARKAATTVGVRDLGMALRMLEDQMRAAPPARDADEARYWARVLELAALVGEVLRAKHGQACRWIQSDRALIPFGFEIPNGESTTIMFPTNGAKRLLDDESEVSMFELITALDEALDRSPDAATGRLMPSLRDRDAVVLDEVVWRSIVDVDHPSTLPIVVCGFDGPSTFGMMRRDKVERSPDDMFAEALANLAEEEVEQEELHVGERMILIVGGSFYAAEKVLDVAFMRQLHADLGARVLAVATPSRGVMLVTSGDDPRFVTGFAELAKRRHAEAGARALSTAILMVADGEVRGYVQERAETPPQPAPETPPKRPGLLRRLFGRGKS